MKNLAVIPARSGSFRLKDKNIIDLCGKPLMAYTVEAAIKSGMFSNIVVSTDSPIYAEIAKKYGAECPFLREEELSSSSASSWDVVLDAVNRYQEKGLFFDTVTLLQPTSPLRTHEDIIEGFKLFEEKNANAVIGVCEAEHSPLRCNILPQDLSLAGFIDKKYSNLPRQMLSTYYRVNGALYIVKIEVLKDNVNNLYDNGSYAYIMPKENSVDIDDEFDLMLAKTVLLQKNMNS